MCLIKTHRFPKISRKPIQVYKVFRLECDKLITLYQEQVCNIGETIKSKNSWIKGIFKTEIKEEGVHAYAYKDVAKEVAFYIFNYYVVVYLCEIPPFTPYWVGKAGDIAASKMVIKEKVEL